MQGNKLNLVHRDNIFSHTFPVLNSLLTQKSLIFVQDIKCRALQISFSQQHDKSYNAHILVGGDLHEH